MCFAEPGQVVSVEGDLAEVLVDDVVTSAALSVVRAQDIHLAPGDWVLVALGLVLERVSAAEGAELVDAVADLRRRPMR
jgi:hydrogenase assembly chaperone HypC/HupF